MAENNLMLALWREAGRHADATDSIPLLAGLLAASLPVSGLRLDERSHELSDLVTLAEWSARNGLGQRGQSRGCSAAGMAAFERWAATARDWSSARRANTGPRCCAISIRVPTATGRLPARC